MSTQSINNQLVNNPQIDYEKLASAIANKLGMLPPPEAIIWSSEQCANYLGIGRRHFSDRVSKSYDFPAPIKLPTVTGSKGHDRWYAIDIQAWAKKYKRKA